MIDVPVSAQFVLLACLLVISGFFCLAETAMMAANRYRLRHLAQAGHRGARLALDLLSRTDKLLGVILLFNNLINAAAATLVSIIAIQLFGEEDSNASRASNTSPRCIIPFRCLKSLPQLTVPQVSSTVTTLD